jgi:type VI secretion system protein ImpF
VPGGGIRRRLAPCLRFDQRLEFRKNSILIKTPRQHTANYAQTSTQAVHRQAMSQSKQYIQLSVFDRLNFDSGFGQIGGQTDDIIIVRQAVLRDVENLLNTRRNIIVPTEGYRHLKDSLYVYGLEDFVSKNPKSPEVRKALNISIEETIAKFEPRLIHVSVEFNQQDGNEQNLCFTVRATLYADPVHEPIYFDTWFSINRGEYRIRNVK